MPVQLPSPALSVWPSRATPVTVGTTTLAGPTGSTSVDGTETAVAEPASLEAVTSLRIVAPTSAPVST